jgi:hypothetical protein
MIVKPKHSPLSANQAGRASDVGVALVLVAFWGAVLAGLIFLLLPTLPIALWLMLASLPGLAALGSPVHLLIDLLLGGVVGLVIGIMRWRWRNRSEVVEELVAAIGSPDIVNAARIGVANAIAHAVAGVAAGLALALVGAHLSGIPDLEIVVPGSAASMALGVAGGGPGGTGGFEGLASLLLALFTVIVVLSALFGLAAGGGLAAVGGGAVTGAAQGVGQGLGAALVLVLTRLWTTELTGEARIARGLHPLTLSEALDSYARRPNCSPGPLIGGYFDWLSASGHQVDPASVVHKFVQWRQVLHQRGRGNPPHVVSEFVQHVERELARRAPEKRLAAANSTPPLAGTAEALLYPGWFRRSLLSGAAAGAMAGALQAMLVAAALLVFGP